LERKQRAQNITEERREMPRREEKEEENRPLGRREFRRMESFQETGVFVNWKGNTHKGEKFLPSSEF
jgi:hypothetical protein